jgi:hypothetical protein
MTRVCGSRFPLAPRAAPMPLYGERQKLRLQKLEPAGVCAEVSIPLRSAPVFVEESSQ